MRTVTLLALCTVLCCSQGHKQEECLNQQILPTMIKDMMETSKLMQKYLPSDNAPFRRIVKLTQKRCSRELNVADFKRILEIYDEHVFQKLWKNNTHRLPKLFMDSFATLKNRVEICETQGKKTPSRCARENLKTIENKFMMLEPKGLFKAQREFRSVLVWISNAMDKSRKHEIP